MLLFQLLQVVLLLLGRRSRRQVLLLTVLLQLLLVLLELLKKSGTGPGCSECGARPGRQRAVEHARALGNARLELYARQHT